MVAKVDLHGMGIFTVLGGAGTPLGGQMASRTCCSTEGPFFLSVSVLFCIHI